MKCLTNVHFHPERRSLGLIMLTPPERDDMWNEQTWSQDYLLSGSERVLLRGRGMFVSESSPVDRKTVFNDSAEEQTAVSHVMSKRDQN